MVRWGWIGALAALVIAATTALPGQGRPGQGATGHDHRGHGALAGARRARRLQPVPAGRLRRRQGPLPRALPPARPRRHQGGLDKGQELTGRPDRGQRIPPLIAVMPDAPWSERGNWYVDSRHTGGKPVETAFTRDLVQHVDATYRTAPLRNARLVGGLLDGRSGRAALRPRPPGPVRRAIVLSPAVYTPLPPADSSTREYGAFGDGDAAFSEKVYTEAELPRPARHGGSPTCRAGLFHRRRRRRVRQPRPPRRPATTSTSSPPRSTTPCGACRDSRPSCASWTAATTGACGPPRSSRP
ncbi:hypothetical protein [Nonomuraea dietziae]|uniref:hypothetical protein n=1 Tax=Nonomuraea dietziae TaxID=65515 RepID=UPI0031D64837